MELRQRLQMKLAQKLVMTPNLQLAIKLLQLNKIELQQAIGQELLENPLLETEESGTDGESAPEATSESSVEESSSETDRLSEVEWESILSEDYGRDYMPRERKDPIPYENIISRSDTLEEHLNWQLSLSNLDPVDSRLGLSIIGSIRDDGYLAATLEEIAQQEGVPESRVATVLEVIQSFDPTGVGARDPRECLLIQIRGTELEGTLVERILQDHLSLLERRAYPHLARATGATLEEVLEASEAIRRLEPKPGRAYTSERVSYIEPDVYISKVDGEYVVLLNAEGIPRLRISRLYRRLLLSSQNSTTRETREYVEKKLASARWLMKSIEQRQKTVYRVAESILRFQQDFFDHGTAYLRPLVLRDVADDIGMHESTVSRVSANKYMHTPQGIYRFKFFFHSGLDSRGGEEISSIRVKEMIKNTILGEDPKKPYSDKKIGELLEQQGIQIARRTVAKYREELKILPSSRRRAYV